MNPTDPMTTNYCHNLGVSTWGAHYEHPVINQIFHPEGGWTRYGKRGDVALVRQLQAAGVTIIQLRCATHRVNFTADEIIEGGINL